MSWVTFPIFLLACLAAGATGMLFGPGDWYAGLDKPGFTPPRWVFPLAWHGLYILMSLAAARVPAMLGAFWRLDTWAGLMILPYLARLTLAGALNAAVWRMNPGAAAGAAGGQRGQPALTCWRRACSTGSV